MVGDQHSMSCLKDCSDRKVGSHCSQTLCQLIHGVYGGSEGIGVAVEEVSVHPILEEDLNHLSPPSEVAKI